MNQDDDVWLSRRGTRHQQKCCHCSSRGDTFPSGHTKPPMCEHCIQMHHITPIQHCPFGQALLGACGSYFFPDHILSTLLCLVRIVPALTRAPCLVGDVMRVVVEITPLDIGQDGVVPLMVVWIILQPLGPWQCLDDIATRSTTYNAICTLTVAAFRRLLRQERAFYHQTPSEAKSIGWWIDTLLAAAAQDVPRELGLPFFRSIGVSSRCKVDADRITLQRVLPVDTVQTNSRMARSHSASTAAMGGYPSFFVRMLRQKATPYLPRNAVQGVLPFPSRELLGGTLQPVPGSPRQASTTGGAAPVGGSILQLPCTMPGEALQQAVP